MIRQTIGLLTGITSFAFASMLSTVIHSKSLFALSAGNQNASTTPTAVGSTLQPSTNTIVIQTPSEQVKRESVMLKVNNMDLEKVALFMSVNLVVPTIDCPYTAARRFYSFFFFQLIIQE